jgi:glycosyltransferase involved in cell wall biosynthesis
MPKAKTRSPKVKLALAMIVKGSDDEAERLRRCLSLSAHSVDGVFITITQPNEAVEKVCKMYHARISHFEWCNDFSKARNFNFEQVTKSYTHILWLDADDGLRGIERLKGILYEHPEVDTFVLNYLYAFDEDRNPTIVHMKTQVVKNDGCVVWKGMIHEDLQPTRDINPWFLQGIDRIHLTDEKHSEESRERNLEIAMEQAKKEENDPRSWWNLGNAYRGVNDYQMALDAFDIFLDDSQADEEKYLCRLRRAECYWALGKRTHAIQEAQLAIGIRPEYPDAYNVLGSLYLDDGMYEDSIKTYLSGIVKKPPIHSILVYNPRDYDWQPMKNLAKAYWMFGRPDMSLPLLEKCLELVPSDPETERIVVQLREETRIFNEVLKAAERLKQITDRDELKRELDALPIEYQAHPAIAVIRNSTFVKETSSGRDLVFYCGNTGETWNPETAKQKGIGGSEEAIIWLSKLLTERGWNVEVYANCGTEDRIHDGVKWRPFWLWNVRDKQDAVVIWRHPSPLKFDINATKIYVDLHDVIQDGEFTPERIAKITKVFVKSQFHRSLFPSIPDEKVIVCPNGIDASIFETDSVREPLLMVNTSSPERSLSALLDCFEEIKKVVPAVRLKWAYGWRVFEIAHSTNEKMMAFKDRMQKRMKDLGVEELGRVSHSEVAELYRRANVFAYPSEFAEIDCISLSKAMAAGAIPITTDFSAMKEKKGHGGVFLHSKKTKETWAEPYQIDFAMHDKAMQKQWTQDAIRFLQNAPSEQARNSMREWARFTFDWNKVADVWHNELCA